MRMLLSIAASKEDQRRREKDFSIWVRNEKEGGGKDLERRQALNPNVKLTKQLGEVVAQGGGRNDGCNWGGKTPPRHMGATNS